MRESGTEYVEVPVRNVGHFPSLAIIESYGSDDDCLLDVVGWFGSFWTDQFTVYSQV